jgi:hypothetical protein
MGDESSVSTDYETTFEGNSEARLVTALSEVSKQNPEFGFLPEMADDMVPASLLRIPEAPELECRIRGASLSTEGARNLIEFLCHSFQAELLLLQHAGLSWKISVPLWTALGDHSLPGEVAAAGEASLDQLQANAICLSSTVAFRNFKNRVA